MADTSKRGADASPFRYADIFGAAERLAGVATTTPVVRHRVFDEMAGASVFIKAESLQVSGSFKFRGAWNAVSKLSRPEQEAGVVAYSSGNHGQAVAVAAARKGIPATIVMPNDAPFEKVEGVVAAGAAIVRYDRYSEDRHAIATEIAEREGKTLIPPYDSYAVMAGQGTVAHEFHRQVTSLDLLVVSVGGGGLLAGCATATRALAPRCGMYGVEPAAGNDHLLSREAGQRVTIEVPRTIADGQQVQSPGELTWPINEDLVVGFTTATDQQIVATMRLLFEHSNLVVEPSGACGLAAVLHGAIDVTGLRVGVVLSGGNVSIERFAALMNEFS